MLPNKGSKMVGVVGRGGEEIEISGPRVRASEVE